MAKALTMPTAPEAPMAPQVSIGERIHGIESRIEEIEDISGMNGVSQSRDKSRQSQREESSDNSEGQSEQNEKPAQTSQQKQTTPQTQQRQPSSRNVTTPETMARDAVANGSGALTKRTTTRAKDEGNANTDNTGSQSKNQKTVVIPPNSLLNDDGRTRSEKGRAVLNEFKQLDQEETAQSNLGANQSSSSTSSAGLFAPSHSSSSEHGAAYWLFTVIAVVILAFVFIRQFMINRKNSKEEPFKPSLNKPQISGKLALDKYNQSKPVSTKPPEKPSMPAAVPSLKPVSLQQPPKVKPVSLKTKSSVKTEDDNKGSHFEVRV